MSASPSLLILGATSGMARAVARRYAAAGYSLILAGRDVAEMERDAADLALRGAPMVACHTFDALDLASHAAFLAGLGETPDMALCAVGFMADQAACDADPALADRVARSNFNGPAHILSLIGSAMAARGAGMIVGISSVAGDRGRKSNYSYGAAKAGFTAFLSGLRGRFAAQGVHVMTVKPGFVRTRMTAGMDLPAALTADPAEVAEAIFVAARKGRNVIYVKPVWRLIMAIIRAIPEPVFKKLSI
ncbi:MAG TPA: SDR family oxidoreductase [Alphaproteobacteria bacterium]|nr:SDR family oxidoreductase [Alphaproteobacteria bacterium]